MGGLWLTGGTITEVDGQRYHTLNANAVNLSVTNYAKNPSFESNVTDDWAFWQGGSGGSRNSDATQAHVGSKSCRLRSGTSTVQVNTVANVTVANGGNVTVSAWVRCSADPTSTKAGLGIVLDGSPWNMYAQVFATSAANGAWEYLTVTWNNNTGGAKKVRLNASNVFNNSAADVWWDECQLELSAAASTYIDGTLTYGSWTGTAHNSVSVSKAIYPFVYGTLTYVGGSGTVEALVVGGGGGGGSNFGGGGGGGGGVVYDAEYEVTENVIFTWGDGGAGGTSGEQGTTGATSAFGTLTAPGGGGGGTGSLTVAKRNGKNGGCGGGATAYTSAASGTPGTGSPGYGGGSGASSGGLIAGGGGGGMAAVGQSASVASKYAGAGGAGVGYDISGSHVHYSGGGGGAVNNATYTQGVGVDGGGNGNKAANGGAGTAGSGGGGGGAGDYNYLGGKGGSGVILVKYDATDYAVLTKTLAGFTCAGTGTVQTHPGSLAATLAKTTLAATAESTISGAADVELANATLEATGEAAETSTEGALDQTLADATLDGDADVAIVGQLASTADDVELVGAGYVVSAAGTKYSVQIIMG